MRSAGLVFSHIVDEDHLFPTDNSITLRFSLFIVLKVKNFPVYSEI